MRYYIIAGEASGDLHGSNLINELKKIDTIATIRCWGGDLMQQAGGELVKHYRDLAFMGFLEVVKNLGTIMKNLRFCKNDILRFKPDALVLIDYPGFNLRIAEWAKKHGFRVIYYISPQVWAWKENRVKAIKESVNKMLVILPFEKEFYKRWNYEVEYVGHPLVEVVENAKANFTVIHPAADSPLNEKSIVAILPGSRKQEVEKKLPLMLEASKHFPDHHFIVAKASSLEDSFYGELMQSYPKVRSVRNNTYSLLMRAKAALVTSGTATLETALFGIPQVVCYKGSNISYQIAKRLVKIKYISLVNLIMNRPVVTELIQNDLTVENIHRELNKLLHDNKALQTMTQDYHSLWKLLSEGGRASAKAARSIVDFLKN
ncbi:MAG: lipid-A-disaccharide synthase [Chitinophagaceae bacterium]|nr:lipid-A-disaccharide synthase [Chitinophagaceae bacterium]